MDEGKPTRAKWWSRPRPSRPDDLQARDETPAETSPAADPDPAPDLTGAPAPTPAAPGPDPATAFGPDAASEPTPPTRAQAPAPAADSGATTATTTTDAASGTAEGAAAGRSAAEGADGLVGGRESAAAAAEPEDYIVQAPANPAALPAHAPANPTAPSRIPPTTPSDRPEAATSAADRPGAEGPASGHEAPVAPSDASGSRAHPALPADSPGTERPLDRPEAQTAPAGRPGPPTPPADRPAPLHDPDPYSTPPYGKPGPWAPAPPVQHPGATPAQGTPVPPLAPGATAGQSAPGAPAPGMTPAHGTPVPGAAPAYDTAPTVPYTGQRPDHAAQGFAPPQAATPPTVPHHAHPPAHPQPRHQAGPGLQAGHHPHAQPLATTERIAAVPPQQTSGYSAQPADLAGPMAPGSPGGPAGAGGHWHPYAPWAAPAAPFQQNGAVPPRAGRGRRGASVGVIVIALLAGLLGGMLGSYLQEEETDVKLPQAGQESPKRDPDSVAGIAASALPGVVTLHVRGDEEQGTGTGFVLDAKGHILTNNHVIQPAGSDGDISVTFSGGQTAKAEVVGHDTGYDLAVVKVSGVSGLKPLPLGNSDNVQVGDPVVAIGAPFDLANTVTSGIISAKERPITTAGGEDSDGSDVSYVDALQTDAPINPGNSGGPLVDGKARVIGINSAIRSADDGQDPTGGQAGSIGLGFAIPVNQAKRVAEELINTGTATHPVIGVTLDMNYTGDGARVADHGNDGGPAVNKNGPADDAGIRAGDVVTQVDGKPVHSGEELIIKIRAHRPGAKLELTLRSEGGDDGRKVTLVLGGAKGT